MLFANQLVNFQREHIFQTFTLAEAQILGQRVVENQAAQGGIDDFGSLFALNAFHLETIRNDILAFLAIICISITLKLFSIRQDLGVINPISFKDLKGRIISASIYAFILITTGIIFSLLTGLSVLRTVSYSISAVCAVAYVIIFSSNIPLKKNEGGSKVSFFNRLTAKKRLEYETITWQFHKASDLSDLECEVLEKYPDLKAEYDEIQRMVEDLMGDLLSPHSYNSRYYEEKISALLDHRMFFEKRAPYLKAKNFTYTM